MSYHDVTKELAISIAILEKARFKIEGDRGNYRTRAHYHKAMRIVENAIRHLHDRWNRLKALWADLHDKFDETPSAVNKRIQKAIEKQKKAMDKHHMRCV